jgi:nitroreductase
VIPELVKATRTVRRFKEDLNLDQGTLEELVDLARFGGSARNSQTLRYMIVTDRGRRERIFPHLGWAGYLADWSGPSEGERPAAYIVCLLVLDRCVGPENEAHFDLGISTQNILLGAAEKGIYGCRIGSFSKNLSIHLGVDDSHKILLVLALGYPAENIVIEEIGKDHDVRYWRDSHGIHHVPKRSLEDILYQPSLASPGSST